MKTEKVTPIFDIRDAYGRHPHKPKVMRKENPGNDIYDEDYLEDIHQEGLDFMDEEKYEKAIKEFKKITNYSYYPEYTADFAVWYYDAWNHIGECLMELEEPEKAEAIFQDIVKHNPDDDDFLFNLALAWGDLEKHEMAIEAYKKILKHDSKQLDALVNISDEYISMDMPEKVIEFADKALKIDSKDPEALSNKGLGLIMKKDYKNALKCFEKSIKEDPTDPINWHCKAVCLVSLGYNEEDVFDSLVVAKALEPEYFKDKETLKVIKENFESLNKHRLKKILS